MPWTAEKTDQRILDEIKLELTLKSQMTKLGSLTLELWTEMRRQTLLEKMNGNRKQREEDGLAQ